MTKYKILEILRNCKGEFISGEFLSEKLQVSRTAIWKGINSLKEKGYKIEGINNKGYRLFDDTGDTISEYEIKKNLKILPRLEKEKKMYIAFSPFIKFVRDGSISRFILICREHF